MAATDVTVVVCVHARRFYCFLWIVETLHLCGVLSTATAVRIVDRWSLPILAPYAKKPRGRFRLWR